MSNDKRDILQEQVTSEPGVSDVGIEIRRGDERNPGAVSHGYGRVTSPEKHKQNAKNHLKLIIDNMKKQPKPNLTKADEKGVHGNVVSDHAAERYGISDAGRNTRANKEARDRGMWNHAVSTKETAKRFHQGVIDAMKKQPKPNLPKSEPEAKDLKKDDYWSKRIKSLNQEKHAAKQKQLEAHFSAKGQPVPEHLKTPQASTMDYTAMKPEFEAKQRQAAAPKPAQPSKTMAPASPKSNKLFDPELSGTVTYKKAEVHPSRITDPVIQNRTTMSAPLTITGPNIMDETKHTGIKKCGDVLKRMIGTLKKVDPKTRLPGVLISKNSEGKK